MADPSISSSPVTPIGKRWKRAFTLILAITGRMLVIAGGILTGASAVLPWLHLSIVVNANANIVIFNLREEAIAAAAFVEAARVRGVLVVAFGPRTVRAVTHLDVTRDECSRAGAILAEVAAAPA